MHPGIVAGDRMDKLCREKAVKHGWTPDAEVGHLVTTWELVDSGAPIARADPPTEMVERIRASIAGGRDRPEFGTFVEQQTWAARYALIRQRSLEAASE